MNWNLSLSISSFRIKFGGLAWDMKKKLDMLRAIHYHIHAFTDQSNTRRFLKSGTTGFSGIKNLEGIDYPIGVIEKKVICAMIDARGTHFILRMNGYLRRDLDSIKDMSYGNKPQHTVECKISDP